LLIEVPEDTMDGFGATISFKGSPISFPINILLPPEKDAGIFAILWGFGQVPGCVGKVVYSLAT
jgi:hypothetical protein